MPKDDTIRLSDIPTLDIETLTLGEMSQAEIQSGMRFETLLTSGRSTLRLLALWVQERRTSNEPRSWQELSNLRPLGKRSLASPSVSSGPPERSSD